MQKIGAQIGMPAISVHSALLTRPINGRGSCLYATPCLRGCSVRANFQSTTVLLPPAMRTGRLTIRTRAMAYEIGIDARGRTNGIHYIDKPSGAHRFVAAGAVVLAASAMESSRILLNSKSNRFPSGVGNDSGQVGRYISDTVGSMVTAQVPALEGLAPHNDFGASVDHVYVPWWGLGEKRAGRLDFPRGYHFELGGGRQEPNAFFLGNLLQVAQASHGAKLKAELRRYYGSIVTLTQRGEMIPNDDSYVEIDPDAKDRWGVGSLRFHFRSGQYEQRQTAHAQRSAIEFLEAAGGRILDSGAEARAVSIGGSIIHEIGGARMGTSAANSVVDSFGRSWAVPNLYVADGAVFPTHPHKNPTLTILALAWRASDHLKRSMENAI